MTSNADPVRRTPRYQSLLAELRSGQKTVLLDGPISTELDSRGVTMASGKARRVAKDDPESLVQLHVDYINAGARIITTHTFGGTRDVLGREFEELTRGAVDCALEARRRTGTEDSVIVAGSLAYHSAKGPGRWDPTQDPEAWERDINDSVDLLSADVDVLLLEMVGGPTFTAPIIRAVQANRMPFWVGFSAYEEVDGHGLRVFDNAATPIDDALPGLIQLAIEGPEGVFKGEGDSGADVIGAMHCKPAVLGTVLGGPCRRTGGTARCWRTRTTCKNGTPRLPRLCTVTTPSTLTALTASTGDEIFRSAASLELAAGSP